MTFVLPAPFSDFAEDYGVDGRDRGAFTEGAWSSANDKAQGSLPLSHSRQATGFVNSTTTAFQGNYFEWFAATTFDVTTDTKVMILIYQYNAPNRLELDTKANDGLVLRLGSDSTDPSPPANYKTFQMGGRDTALGKERAFPVHLVLDLNADSEDAEVNTLDLTNVETYGIGSKTLNMAGSTTYIFIAPGYLLDTTKNATNIPRFTGASDWDDIITAMGTVYSTKITHGWLAREGSIFAVACPLEFGDNSTSTQFDDNGAAVFWPNNNDPLDPKIRITEQAFRVYSNLRNNAADTIDMSGSYDCGDSYPPWDFDQDDAAIITFASVNFKRTGTFLMGSSVIGPAIFDDCGVVTYQDNGVDLDGSTFKNPHADHLLALAA